MMNKENITVDYKCPNCNAELEIPLEILVGTELKCPECNHVFKLVDPETKETYPKKSEDPNIVHHTCPNCNEAIDIEITPKMQHMKKLYCPKCKQPYPFTKPKTKDTKPSKVKEPSKLTKNQKKSRNATLFFLGLIMLFAAVNIIKGIMYKPTASELRQLQRTLPYNVEKCEPFQINIVKEFWKQSLSYDPGSFCYTKSKDFKEVYFIGGIIIEDDKRYKCIWTSTSSFINSQSGGNTLMSANNNAVAFSVCPDVRRSQARVDSKIDGYARIDDCLNRFLH